MSALFDFHVIRLQYHDSYQVCEEEKPGFAFSSMTKHGELVSFKGALPVGRACQLPTLTLSTSFPRFRSSQISCGQGDRSSLFVARLFVSADPFQST